MKPTEEFYEFFKLKKAFLEQLDFFDPEPQIVAALQFFPEIKTDQLSRLITWQGITSDNKVTDLRHDRQTFPFINQLAQTPSGPLFRIHEVKWFFKLWEDRNRYAPDFAPKRLSNGLKFLYTSNKLVVSFQKVSTELWLTSDYNSTTVIPLTHDNFDLVIRQHVELAKKYLQSMEK